MPIFGILLLISTLWRANYSRLVFNFITIIRYSVAIFFCSGCEDDANSIFARRWMNFEVQSFMNVAAYCTHIITLHVCYIELDRYSIWVVHVPKTSGRIWMHIESTEITVEMRHFQLNDGYRSTHQTKWWIKDLRLVHNRKLSAIVRCAGV